LPPRASIGVPLYCCPVVFKAIKAAGFRPRFIDIDPDTYCISATDLAVKSAELDVVIAVHMFGNVCDMPALREAAPGKPLIEDCAQSLGSRLNGRLTGSLGDLGVFSFRLGKYLSVGEGGAIYCASADLKSKLSNLINELPVPTRSDEIIHVANTYLRSLLRAKPMWGIIGSRLWDAYSKRVRYESQSPLALGQIFETDRQMAGRRLPPLDSWIDKQRSNADYFARNIIVEAGMLCRETGGAFFNRFQYPILAQSSRQCEQLVSFLREKQISTARPYKDIATIASTHYDYIGDCPQAERVARSVLVIPCNHSLNAGDVERVASAVNRAWSKAGAC
jgi:dTDP-4-amino-4,6-dideoxygalactose transaminase